ncbi:MAG: hypothetical protein JXA44_02530 [Methanospirillaceae archaeon]|nr:hypothetical protein [Methanospirillaceae archaeon]
MMEGRGFEIKNNPDFSGNITKDAGSRIFLGLVQISRAEHAKGMTNGTDSIFPKNRSQPEGRAISMKQRNFPGLTINDAGLRVYIHRKNRLQKESRCISIDPVCRVFLN